MYRYWWCVFLGVSLTFCCLTSLLVATTSFHFRHPRYSQLRFDVTRDGQVILNPAVGLKPLIGTGTPRVVVVKTVHDFGYMAPATRGEHIFSITNQGTGNLLLTVKSTTCRCTVAALPSGVIPPGESAEVCVQWHTPSSQQNDPFCESVALATNDPLNPELVLTIQGQVRQPVWAEPAEILLPDLLPNEQRKVVVALHSDVWPAVEVTSLAWSIPIPGLHGRVVGDHHPPAAALTTAKCLLEINATDELPTGYFTTSLLVTARRPEADRNFQWEIPVSGTRLGRYCVFGPSIDGNGDCVIGKVMKGQSVRKTLTLRVRDGQTATVEDLRVASSSPNLRVVVQPSSRSNDRFPLFLLHLEIPNDAAECNHLGVDPAIVTIGSRFDTEAQRVLRLPVRFAVVTNWAETSWSATEGT